MVKQLPTGGSDIRFTAGLDKLVVALPGTKTIQRWDLKTFQREASMTIDLLDPKTILQVAMGSASEGPLFVATNPGGRATLSVLELKTLQPLPIELAMPQSIVFDRFMQLRASAAGSVLGMWNPGAEPSGLQICVGKGLKLESVLQQQCQPCCI